MIFILTFSLVSVSGYRVDKLLELAHQRLSTIAIGASICIFTTVLFCPVWAGQELHSLIVTNIQKLSESLNGMNYEQLTNKQTINCIHRRENLTIYIYMCVCFSASTAEYFKNDDEEENDDGVSRKNGYKCVLNSKATEESMVLLLISRTLF